MSFPGVFSIKGGHFPNEFLHMGIQASSAESGGWRRFSLEWLYSVHLSSSLCWWGLSGPLTSFTLHPPSSSLNHSDPAHLEPMCFSILSSTVVISNQPMGLSLSPHQQPGSSSVISSQSEGCGLHITVPAFLLRHAWKG